MARFNMSHGTHDELKARMDLVKEAIRESGKSVAILIDTKGPEVRLEPLKMDPSRFRKDSNFH